MVGGVRGTNESVNGWLAANGRGERGGFTTAVDVAPFTERLLALRNDVGLLSEEFDLRTGRMLGNFPQALSHMALVNTARLLSLPPGELDASSRKGERPAAAKATS